MSTARKVTLPSKGFGPFRTEFYSICSRHMGSGEDDCATCRVGRWHNVMVHNFDNMVYRWCQPLWLWWHNRPNSRSKRELRRIFPNLR